VNKRIPYVVVFLLVLAVGHAQNTHMSKKTVEIRSGLKKTAGTSDYAMFSVSNITAWIRSDGSGSPPPAFAPQGEEAYFPRGAANVVYKDGFVWGGKAYLDAAHSLPAEPYVVRVGGSTYGTGVRPGYVTGSGATAFPADTLNPEVRVYRIRRDYRELRPWVGNYTSDLAWDAAAVFGVSFVSVTQEEMDQVYNRYEQDWTQWPVQLGAPYIERNGVPGYQPPPAFSSLFTKDSLISGHYDEPGITGPGIDSPADQVVWTVYNDLDEAVALAFLSSPPLGLEVQRTVWGYRTNGPMGDIYLSRFRFINKGGIDIDSAAGMQRGIFYIDSMYATQWSDPDIGSFSNDLIGCDTLLNLGYCYDAGNDPDFKAFGLPPPSIGYVVLQGPLVPSPVDTAIFDMRQIAGFRNEKMTSFSYEGAGTPYSDPPSGVPGGYEGTTGQWWKIIRGYAPVGTLNDPDQYYAHPPGTPGTKYAYSGDPVTRTGFIDGLGTSWSYVPGDIKMMINSGPFSLAAGDTQEVVYAFVAGLGADALSSITVMKTRARFAHTIFETGFAVPKSPAGPSLRATALDGEIVLNWGSEQSTVQATEATVIAHDYRFQGYNLYQLPKSTSRLGDGIKVATFDLIDGITTILDPDPAKPYLQAVVEVGKDTGIRRYFTVTKDYLSGGTDNLHNGQEYTFAVTAYNYSADPLAFPKSLESAPALVTVQPQIPFGTSVPASPGDSIAVIHAAGTSDGAVHITVVDPLAFSDASYMIRFDTTANGTEWNLTNTKTNTTVVSNVNFDEAGTIVEGGVLVVILSGTQPFSTSDEYTYSLPAVRRGLALQQASAKRVGVFPNPYIAGRSQETTTWRHFVTFNNLPPRVTIRIFNLAGHLVRKLEKNDPSQFLEWDLANENNWQVASGMYICYVEMPDIGETKILKLAVIQPQGGRR